MHAHTNAHAHTHSCTLAHIHTHAHAHAHIHTGAGISGQRDGVKVFEKRNVFKGLTEVTEAACLYRSIATVAAHAVPSPGKPRWLIISAGKS